MKYYKGQLFRTNAIVSDTRKIVFADGLILDKSDSDFFERFKKLPEAEKNVLERFFNDCKQRDFESSDKIKRILEKVLPDLKLAADYQIESKSIIDIIYEIITGEDGNLYGKELITGNIFPIVSNKEMHVSIPMEREPVGLYYDRDRRGVIVKERDGPFYDSYFTDSEGKRYFTGYERAGQYPLYCVTDFDRPIEMGLFYYYHDGIIYTLIYKYDVLFSNLERGEVFIKNNSVVNTNEIAEYQKRYQDTFGNRRKRKGFINLLNDYMQRNVFKWDIIPKKEETRYEKDDITKLMERIEAHLMRLKVYNTEQYDIYSKKYLDLINQDDDSKLKFPITKAILESLEARILLCFEFNKNSGDDILEYLEIKKNEYISNLINNENNDTLSFEEIDKMMELYLRMQKDYDPIKRRKITRYISLLYLFELMENNDLNINLGNSYINDNILSIVLWIKTLNELEIIECNSLIDLSHNYNLDELLEIIGTIKLKNNINEKVKKLQ